MGTVSEKLTYLNGTKTALKDVINLTDAGITSETTFRNYAAKLYDGYIEVLKDRDVLLDNMPKQTVTGTTLSIANAADLPVYEFKMTKESTQETTTGKNLFDKNNVNWYRNNSDLFESTTNTSTNRIRTSSFAIKGGETYTLSGYPSDVVSLVSVRTYDSLQNNITGQVTYDGNTFTLTSSVAYVHLLFSGSNFTNDTNTLMKNADIQIEEGSTATPYEPYTGGIPSPNPNYPQEVKTVKGYRNLFDKNNANVQQAYVNSSNIYKTSTGNVKTIVFPILPNKTYSVSKKSSYVFRLGYMNNFPSNNDTVLGVIDFGTGNFGTITVGDNAQYLICYVLSANDTISELEMLNSIQIVEGTQELPYVPYGNNYVAVNVSDGTTTNKTPIPLNNNEIAGIGDYKDELKVDKSGHVFINKKCGKYIFTGLESDLSYSTTNSMFYTNSHIIDFTVYTILSNRFIYGGIANNTSTAYNKGNNKISINNDGHSFYIRNDNLTSLEMWKAYLSTNEVILYYVLATPELIDLQTTIDLSLFNGTNNISNSASGLMNLEYVKNNGI